MVTLPRPPACPTSNADADADADAEAGSSGSGGGAGIGGVRSKYDGIDAADVDNLRWCQGTPYGVSGGGGGGVSDGDGGGDSDGDGNRGGGRGSKRRRRPDAPEGEAYFDYRKLERMNMDTLGIDFHEPVLVEMRSIDGSWPRDRFREPKNFRLFDLGGEPQ